MKKIFFVSVTDDNYAPHLTTLLYSLLFNVSKKYFVEIRVMIGDLSEVNKRKIKDSLLDFKNYNLIFSKIDEKKFRINKLLVFAHLNHAAYYRLVIPELYKDVDKAIYLDSDTIIRTDISKLWETDFKGKILQAVRMPFSSYGKQLDKTYGIKNEGYFNAGLLLMNIKKMREEKISKKLISFLEKNSDKQTSMDQEALNIVLKDDCQSLPPKWNTMSHVFLAKNYRYTQYSKKDFINAVKNPSIIHFDGHKPWAFGCVHPYTKEYKKYLSKTKYRGLKPIYNYRLFFKNLMMYYGSQVVKILPDKVYDSLFSIFRKVFSLLVGIH